MTKHTYREMLKLIVLKYANDDFSNNQRNLKQLQYTMAVWDEHLDDGRKN